MKEGIIQGSIPCHRGHFQKAPSLFWQHIQNVHKERAKQEKSPLNQPEFSALGCASRLEVRPTQSHFGRHRRHSARPQSLVFPILFNLAEVDLGMRFRILQAIPVSPPSWLTPQVARSFVLPGQLAQHQQCCQRQISFSRSPWHLGWGVGAQTAC